MVSHRKKRRFELGRTAAETRIGERRLRAIRVRGGNVKLKLLACDKASVADPTTGTTKLVTITGVKNNPASRDFTRRNVLTRGALIETEAGLARVTSRPGQEGIVNAVKVEEKS